MMRIKEKVLQEDYVARINRVLDYLEKNLSRELNLEQVAKVAHFSPYHFHRIFRAMVGEPLNQFIKRIRLEKSAHLLWAEPNKSITDVALDCGFQSSAAFSRAFKSFFGKNPSQWKENTFLGQSKNGQMEGNNGKNGPLLSSYVLSNDYYEEQRRKNTMTNEPKIEVKNLDPSTVAYIRHIGPYKGDGALFERLFGELFRWAGPRNLCNQNTKVMAVYHDNPEITDEEKLRLSICLSVPDETEVEGKIGKMQLAGGKYAVAHFELKNEEYEKAWNYVFGTWLPQSGYQPDDKPCFELYLNDPKEHPEGLHIVNICVPVKPL